MIVQPGYRDFASTTSVPCCFIAMVLKLKAILERKGQQTTSSRMHLYPFMVPSSSCCNTQIIELNHTPTPFICHQSYRFHINRPLQCINHKEYLSCCYGLNLPCKLLPEHHHLPPQSTAFRLPLLSNSPKSVMHGTT